MVPVLGEETVVSRSFAPFRRFGLLLTGLAVVAACSAPAAPTSPSTPPAPTTAPPAAATSALPSPTPVPAAPCSSGWGSEVKTVPGLGPAPVVAVRTGTDPCADRVEFELDGPAAGYSVAYVDQVVQDGSGAVLPVTGNARLQVQLNHPGYNDAGQATFTGRVGEPLPSVSGYPSLQAVVFAGSFEGYSTFGVGVRARLPFRVSIAEGPQARSRIVLEIAHTWS